MEEEVGRLRDKPKKNIYNGYVRVINYYGARYIILKAVHMMLVKIFCLPCTECIFFFSSSRLDNQLLKNGPERAAETETMVVLVG